jgi:hypothetical protein
MADTKKGSMVHEDCTSQYETMQMGIYQVTFGDQKRHAHVTFPGKEQYDHVRTLITMLPGARRFIVDVFTLAPELSALLWALQFLQTLVPGLHLYNTNWLMSTVSFRYRTMTRRTEHAQIEKGAKTGQMETQQIQRAMMIRLLVIALSYLLGRVMYAIEA